MSKFKYKAFISYSHKDAKWANWLHRTLEAYRIPKRLRESIASTSGLAPITPVFIDRDELATASNLSKSIEDALIDSQCLLVVCSPSAARSRWVNEEVKRFQELGRSEQIFCLIVDGNPGADAGAESDCFVPSLRCLSDGVAIEPLAADVRPEGDGRKEARLKLVAGILGLGYDELKRRELQRRFRNLVVITTASITGMILAVVMATVTLLARQEADEQRHIAEREAETATQTAEFLVDLFSVVDPNVSRGRSITAYEILETGRNRITYQLKDQPDIRSRLLTTMGRVYTGLGLYDTALEVLEEGGQADAAQSIERQVALGNAFYLFGNYEKARDVFTDAVKKVELLQGGGKTWSQNDSDAFGGLANATLELDDLAEANRLFSVALVNDRARWGNTHEQVAKSLAGLATVHLFQNNLERSEEYFTGALDAYLQVIGPEHPRTIEVRINLGTLRYLKNDHLGALRFFEEAMPLTRKIYGDMHPETASLANNIGRILLLGGELKRADRLLSESVAIDRSLGRDHHDDLVFALNSLGLTKATLNEVDAAQELYDEALSLATETAHPMLGQILVNRTDLNCRTNPADSVIDDLSEARAALIRDYGPESWRLAILDNVLGTCLVALQQVSHGVNLLRSSYGQIEQRWGVGILYTDAARERLVSGCQRESLDTGGNPEYCWGQSKVPE